MLTPEQMKIAMRLRRHLAQMRSPGDEPEEEPQPAPMSEPVTSLSAPVANPVGLPTRAAGVLPRAPAPEPNMGAELDRGDEASRRSALIAGITRAGGMAGAAIGGTKLDTSPYDRMDRLADDPRNTAQARVKRLEGLLREKRAMDAAKAEAERKAAQDKFGNIATALGIKLKGEDNTRADSIAKENARHNLETEKNGRIAAQNAGVVRTERADDRLDKRVTTHAGNVKDMQGVISSLQNVDAVIARVEGPDGKGFDTDKELPGVGPGVRNSVANVLGNWVLSKDGQDMRAAGSDLSADVLRAYSGAAASDRELMRTLQRLGQGAFSTRGEFLGALKRVRAFVADQVQNAEAGAGPEVVGRFANQGGRTSGAVRSIGAREAQGVPMVGPNGESGTLDPSEVAEAEQNGWKRR